MNLPRGLAIGSIGVLLLLATACASTPPRPPSVDVSTAPAATPAVVLSGSNPDGGSPALAIGGSATLPAGWPVEIKLPADAKIDISSSTHEGALLQVGFMTGEPQTAAVLFFKDELTGAGFTAATGPAFTDYIQEYSRDGNTLLVNVLGQLDTGLQINLGYSIATNAETTTAETTTAETATAETATAETTG